MDGAVFISYARQDGFDDARRLDEEIRRAGFTTWRDMRDIDITSDFTAEIERAIRNCQVMVLCLSGDVTRGDSFVRREIAFALAVRRPIIVARFADLIPPISVVTHTYVDFFSSFDHGLAQVLGFIRRNESDSPAADNEADPAAWVPPQREYLEALYGEIVDILDEAVLLPLTGRQGQLLDLSGLLTAAPPPAQHRVLAQRFRRPPPAAMDVTVGDAYRYAGGRLGIIGEAGSGKTISLLALARDLAATALTEPGAPLPILLSAATWGAERRTETSLIDWIGREVPALGPQIVRLIDADKVVLLIDGLDEVPVVRGRDDSQGSIRDELIDRLPSVGPLIIAGRPEAFAAVRSRLRIRVEFALQPLDDQQIASFSRNVPEVRTVLSSDHVLHEIARTPLLLTMLCSAIGVAGAGAECVGGLGPNQARDLIVDAFVESRFNRESAGVSISIDDLRHRLGLLALGDAGGGGNRNLFSTARARGQLGVDLLELAHRMGILITTPTGALRFLHVLVRDHFAFQAALRATLDRNDVVRDQAAWALWQIPDPRAFDVLLTMLKDPYPYARGSAAGALGRLGDTRALPALQRLLTDDTSVVSIYGPSIHHVAAAAIAEILAARGHT